MLGPDDPGNAGNKCEVKIDARKLLESSKDSGTYMEFIPPWKEADRGEPLTSVDHFVSVGNVLVLDDEHMNGWLHQEDPMQGESHAFSREKHNRVFQRQFASGCKCFARPNGLSDCCLTNTSGQSLLADDSFPLPWADHKSEDVPQRHVENWSYSCPSEANRSQFEPSMHLPLEEATPNECHLDLGTLHKHQERHHRHHHNHHQCPQLDGLQQLEQFDLRERVHTWLMSIDRSMTDFESIDEIT